MAQDPGAGAEDLEDLARQAIAASSAQDDPDYPRFHVAPPIGRLNDPNGLLADGERYHAFYQLSPFHPHRRLVYWGHSSSPDLLTWTHHEPAIIPDSSYDRNGAYSGNAVVLEAGELDDAPARAPFQLFFTGNLKDPVTDERTASQCLLTSNDLHRFDKWAANPLIPHHPEGYTAHFRDPQVSRDPDRPGTFRMLLGAQRADGTGTCLVYRSTDLLTWELSGELVFPDARGALDRLGYMWECPGVVRLADEVTGEPWDVLIWCPQGVGPGGEGPADTSAVEGFENVFPCVYTLGHLVGDELRECAGAFAEVDRGFEFYAPQVVARRPSEPGPVLLLGWAGNAGQDDQPSIASGGWVHTLTVPRRLSVRGGRLIQRPEPALPRQAPSLLEDGADLPASTTPLAGLVGHRSWHIVVELGSPEPGAPDGARLADGEGEMVLEIGTPDRGLRIELHLGDRPRLVVDRSTTRYTEGGARRSVTLPADAPARLEVLHDRSVTEIFVGDGDLAFTLRTFIDPAATGAAIEGTATLPVRSSRGLVHD